MDFQCQSRKLPMQPFVIRVARMQGFYCQEHKFPVPSMPSGSDKLRFPEPKIQVPTPDYQLMNTKLMHVATAPVELNHTAKNKLPRHARNAPSAWLQDAPKRSFEHDNAQKSLPNYTRINETPNKSKTAILARRQTNTNESKSVGQNQHD